MLQKQRFSKTCEVCGNTFNVIKSKLSKQRTCSFRCGREVFKQAPIERFWKYVRLHFELTDEDCWEWSGYKDKDGYGAFCLSSKQKVIGAHRFIYAYFKNRFINSKVLICHKCDNPSCVNPSHLFEGSARDNVLDCHAKGRSRWQKC